MRTLSGSVSGYYSDENIWLQERQYINVTSIANVSGETWRTMYVSLQDSNGNEVARYAVDSSKKALIDLTEYLRALAGGLGTQFSIKIAAYYSVSGTYAAAQTLTFTPVGLISPERLLVPLTADAAALTEACGANKEAAFLFPNKMLGGSEYVSAYIYGFQNVQIATSAAGTLEVWHSGTSMWVAHLFGGFDHGETLQDAKNMMLAAYHNFFGIEGDIEIADDDVDVVGVNVDMYFRQVAKPTQAEVEDYMRDLSDWFVDNYEVFLSGLSEQMTATEAHGLGETNVSATVSCMNYPMPYDMQGVRSFGLVYGSKLYGKRTLQENMCGKRYAMVVWRGAFGGLVAKRAYWEVRDHSVQADETTLQPVAVNEWHRDVKSRADEVTLFLDGLTHFDVWYYSDIVASSSVEVSGFGTVEILTKEVALPDGESGKYALKIKCKLAEYDAVAL